MSVRACNKRKREAPNARDSAKSAKYRGILRVPGKPPGIPTVENTRVVCRFPKFCPRFCPRPALRLSQGNSRVSGGKLERYRMELQTPSGFPGNFWKRKVLGTLWFPSGLPEPLLGWMDHRPTSLSVCLPHSFSPATTKTIACPR